MGLSFSDVKYILGPFWFVTLAGTFSHSVALYMG